MMKKLLAYGIVLVLFLACTGVVSAENLVMNGGFEEPNLNGGTQVYMVSGLSYWNIETESIDLIGSHWKSYEGTQSIDLSSCSRATINQNLVTTPGQSYSLKFAISGNPDVADTNTIRKVKIYWGSDSPIIREFDTKDITSLDDMKWKIIDDLPNFLATSNPTTLKFEDVSDNSYPCAGVALDDIIIEPYPPTSAPEFPSAFLPAAMIIGFLGAVLLIQRTREH